MCGICGYWNAAPEDPHALLESMCDAIHHRGPDDSGYFVDGEVGLGVRRLSIIDLATGHQPVTSKDAPVTVVFNGEIYNHRELRQALMARGHQLSTSSDTEVIAHQFEEDGPACVQKFNGMFAIALWDARARSLLLARDRLGVKPLYYYWDGRRLLFASEIKALLASHMVDRQLNEQAVWDYLTFRYVPQPETIWKNIHKLQPGHLLTLREGEPKLQPERYWDIPNEAAQAKDKDELVQEFEALFLDAVRMRLIADVPVGILLSGGLDSSAVAAAVAEVHSGALRSFSVAFEGAPDIDERPYARQVADCVGTEHSEVVIGQQEFLDFLPKFVHITDEPLADLASVPLYYVSQLAAQSVKVVLSGEGSDEVLAGYDLEKVMSRWARLDKLRRWTPAALRRPLVAAGGRLPPVQAEQVRRAMLPPGDRLASRPPLMTNYLSSQDKRRLWPAAPSVADSLEPIRHTLANQPGRTPLGQVLYQYCQSWLVEDLLMKADKMTMANSIELRVPFLDYRLVEWSARSPDWVKIGPAGKFETKWVLRQFARRRLPDAILSRPKQGFPVPVYDWLSTRLRTWAADLVLDPSAWIRQRFDAGEIDRQYRAGTQTTSRIDQHQLWNLIILELWARAWKPA